MRRWILVAGTVLLAIVTISAWLSATEYPALPPEGDFQPRVVETWMLTGDDAAARRRALLSRAVLRLDPSDAHYFADVATEAIRDEIDGPVSLCRFLGNEPSGTSPKFDCVFDGGAVAKVKYGRNPEIHAETAASRLLRMLGYPTDSVRILPRLRCYGCPRLPFFAMHLRSALSLPLQPAKGVNDGYTDFEWVAIERKFPAPAIETADTEGWSWWELEEAGLPRADIDALKLTAVFLAHWDNKASNQRLVCLDGPPAGPDADCRRPLALIQDLGATFGPTKVNVAQWRRIPVWHDRATCTVSMRALPFRGASFPDAAISEAGRAQLAARLAAIPDADIERLFADARFPVFQIGTDDERDLEAWTGAFRHRVDQIVNTRCPQPGGISS